MIAFLCQSKTFISAALRNRDHAVAVVYCSQNIVQFKPLQKALSHLEQYYWENNKPKSVQILFLMPGCTTQDFISCGIS